MNSRVFASCSISAKVFRTLIALAASYEIGASAETIHFGAELASVGAVDSVAAEETRTFAATRPAGSIATDHRIETA